MITFSTDQLEIIDSTSVVDEIKLTTDFLPQIVSILTSGVVKDLPSYFHGIKTIADAQTWLDKMSQESTLLFIHEASKQELVGFLFVYETGEGVHRLGYLLAEKAWGKGYASEVLLGLITYFKQTGSASGFIAGVSSNNISSIKVLEKVGFNETESKVQGTLYYEYLF